MKSSDPSLNCFGGQVADFDLVNNSLKKGNFTSVTKGRNTEEVSSIVKKFAFASSRKDGSPASVCRFEPTEPDYLGFVNSLA